MADFGKLNFSVSFNPTSAFPLDARYYFDSLAAAQEAASTAVEVGSAEGVYHYGMNLVVVEDGTATMYMIQPSKTLSRLASTTSSGDLAADVLQLQNQVAALESDVAALESKITSVFSFKGTKATEAELPPSNNTVGDVWYVTENETEYVWIADSDGSNGKWEEFGPAIDLSGYLQKPTQIAAQETAGLFKITHDTNGLITSSTAVAKTDITALGIPAQDTTYTMTSAEGAEESNEASIILTPSDGGGSSIKIKGGNGILISDDGTGITVTAEVTEDTDTTYELEASQSDANVKLALSGSDSTSSEVTIQAGTNVTLTAAGGNAVSVAAKDTTYTFAKGTADGSIKVTPSEGSVQELSIVDTTKFVPTPESKLTAQLTPVLVKIAYDENGLITGTEEYTIPEANTYSLGAVHADNDVTVNLTSSGEDDSSIHIKGAGLVTASADTSGNVTITGNGIKSVAAGTKGQIVVTKQDNSTENVSVVTVIDSISTGAEDGVPTVAAVAGYVNSNISSVFKFKGSVANYDNLPSDSVSNGDVYHVEDTGKEYVWIEDEDGTGAWEEIGTTTDVSNFITGVSASDGTSFTKAEGVVTIPLATATVLGLVKGSSSTEENKVAIEADGTMTVNSVNVNKLVQTAGDELILNGGSADVSA